MPDAVYRRHADGKRDIALFFHAALKVRSEVTATLSVAGASATALPVRASPVVSLVEQAMRDQSVAKALRLLAGDPNTWVGLYRIHEVIDNDLGGEHALIKKGWVGSRQLKRFKHSANSVAVGGDSARHGKELTVPPRDPMSLTEAQAYVRYILEAWLVSKNAI